MVYNWQHNFQSTLYILSQNDKTVSTLSPTSVSFFRDIFGDKIWRHDGIFKFYLVLGPIWDDLEESWFFPKIFLMLLCLEQLLKFCKIRLGLFQVPLPHAGQYNIEIKIMLKLVNLFESIIFYKIKKQNKILK